MVRILRIPEVTTAVGLAESTVYTLVRRELFPAPRRLADNSTGWLSTEVEEWIASRPVAKPKKANWGDKRYSGGRKKPVITRAAQ